MTTEISVMYGSEKVNWTPDISPNVAETELETEGCAQSKSGDFSLYVISKPWPRLIRVK